MVLCHVVSPDFLEDQEICTGYSSCDFCSADGPTFDMHACFLSSSDGERSKCFLSVFISYFCVSIQRKKMMTVAEKKAIMYYHIRGTTLLVVVFRCHGCVCRVHACILFSCNMLSTLPGCWYLKSINQPVQSLVERLLAR